MNLTISEFGDELYNELSTRELVSAWNVYCEHNSYYDDYIYSNDQLDECLETKTPTEIIRMCEGNDIQYDADYFKYDESNITMTNYPHDYGWIDLEALAADIMDYESHYKYERAIVRLIEDIEEREEEEEE